ncbi:MAG: hypothetical protein ACUVRF_09805 [Desulfotomaculales bacterium]
MDFTLSESGRYLILARNVDETDANAASFAIYVVLKMELINHAVELAAGAAGGRYEL